MPVFPARVGASDTVRHNCSGKGFPGYDWATCVVCEGRFHLDGCTTKRNPKKDCCEARHALLDSMGIERGIADSSLPMMPWSAGIDHYVSPQDVMIREIKEKMMNWTGMEDPRPTEEAKHLLCEVYDIIFDTD